MEGARKTRIVYQANLNFKMLNKYLAKLKKCGFIEERDGLIYTTDRETFSSASLEKPYS